jgi:predicted nucleic acid-binding protein
MMISASRCLIDTNVVVYARELGGPKSERAREVMRACQRAQAGVLSTQVLAETFAVLTRGAATTAGRAAVAEHIGRLAMAFPVLPAEAATVLFAADCSRRHGLHIFDAMLWAVAMANGIPSVLTEDIGHRRSIDGVTFANPFAEDFDPVELGLQ